MGFFGKLFGGGGPRVPSWARDAFGADVARFDAFLDVVGAVVGDAASPDELRTGSVVLDAREWFLHEAAHDCAGADAAAWREIVERSYRGDGPRGDLPRGDAPFLDEIVMPPRAWIIGTAAWGGAMFECDDAAMVLVLLPIVEGAALDTPPSFPPGLIRCVVVCNGGGEGHLAPAAIARAAGLAHVYAIDPSKIDGVEAKGLDPLTVGALAIERAGTSVFGRWNDGTTFLCGDATPLSEVARRRPRHVVGKIIVDGTGGASIDWLLAIERAVIVANVPGVDADELAGLLGKLGVRSEIVHRPTSRRAQVGALVIAGRLAEADQLAAEAIAAGDDVANLTFQRAMIALMRGDEAAAEDLLAAAESPQALTSRASLAARRGDPAAKQLALRAVAQLPGDAIAITTAIQVHGVLGDRDGARALLAEHGAHLDAEPRVALALAVERGTFELGAHRFPEHARLAAEAARPMLDAGRLADAEAMLRRAHAWDPHDATITAELGFALSQQQRDGDAIAVYDAALARGGSSKLLAFNRGNCHVRAGRFAEAVADFRACLELEAAWHDARVNLVSALFAANDKDGAARELARLKQLGGDPRHVAALEQMLGG